MKIALISPRSSFLGRNAEFTSFLEQAPEMEFYRQYWSGLGSGLLVIGALTPPDVDLELIDENIENLDYRQSYDLVAITAMTEQAARAYEIAGRFREQNTKVVLGGIHATTLPDEARLHVDSVVVGEAENLWPKLLEDFKRNELRSVYTSPQEVDLAESPVPKYELLAKKPYKIVWIQATRGCPHDCAFCCASKVYGSKYRHKSIDQVIEEIKRVRRMNKHALIGFADDNLLCNKDYARRLLEKAAGLQIRWVGQTDVSIANDSGLLRLAKRSGCVVLFIGFESIIEHNLEGLDSSNWKLQHLKNYVTGIKTIQSNGIGIIGTFIVGLDYDDTSVFDKLADFIIENHLAGAQIAALTPFPHTRIRTSLLNEGRVLNTPWDNYTLYDVNIKPKRMNPQELERGILDTFKKVYSSDVAVDKGGYFKNIFSELHKTS